MFLKKDFTLNAVILPCCIRQGLLYNLGWLPTCYPPAPGSKVLELQAYATMSS